MRICGARCASAAALSGLKAAAACVQPRARPCVARPPPRRTHRAVGVACGQAVAGGRPRKHGDRGRSARPHARCRRLRQRANLRARRGKAALKHVSRSPTRALEAHLGALLEAPDADSVEAGCRKQLAGGVEGAAPGGGDDAPRRGGLIAQVGLHHAALRGVCRGGSRRGAWKPARAPTAAAAGGADGAGARRRALAPRFSRAGSGERGWQRRRGAPRVPLSRRLRLADARPVQALLAPRLPTPSARTALRC